jgi:hypothetical protein
MTLSLLEWLGKDKLPAILKEHDYETDPGGITQPIAPNEIVWSPDGKAAYVDVMAGAVCKSGQKPKRPIRVEFERTTGAASPWAVTSVKELEPGVRSLAIDEPWPK